MDADTLRHAPRELHTPRLRLLCPHVDHAAAVMDSINTSLPSLRYISFAQQPWDLPRAQRFCQGGQDMVEAGDCLVFNAFLRDAPGAYVGRIDLHSFDFDTPRGEIGYTGDIRHAGQGLMREAVRAVVQLGFELGCARIQALSEATNHRALHFAEHSLGFRREAVLRHYERDAQGRLGEQVMFAMLAEDWRSL